MISALSYIFGGCCSTAYTLEAIVREAPNSGVLLTFAQFLFIGVEGFLYHCIVNPKALVRPKVPVTRWLIIVFFFFLINVLNNVALAYDISVPVHIILRSSGPITTMAFGAALLHKRYNVKQVVSVCTLTLGIIIATLGNAQNVRLQVSSVTHFAIGVGLLVVTQFMGAFMGLLLEKTYARYKSDWRESLYYTHAFGIPFFFPLWGKIKEQWVGLLTVSQTQEPIIGLPRGVFFLLLNTLAQYVCVRGVNGLGAKQSALAVSIVLNIRKFASLILSILIFKNELGPAVLFGAFLVFGSSAVYATASTKKQKLESKKE
ncbi:NST UDP-N-acetylglucosamine transporter [Schizosaccharomyces japonicus yFS275]|uniref:NST UDP-N-acetylglucosamine transporter n=1 Tax=Schizosaccharomyces japonicus (strain yFS275 / FY16936) TaxID=402676 RepID=B6JVL9_SCHJY|nr:NST UDP-N-acetylglucosamine transporter [Schizosaccharomyces japonicus yFS275]EEB05420.1 NST UDP-N-acetylglucosamine transporter [Schizosaccharomyces japonicus yFS275]